jgi:hypothetical protein
MSPSVLGLTETWLKSHFIDSLLSPSSGPYSVFRKDRSSQKKGGGVAFLIFKSLNPVLVHSSGDKAGYELLCVDISSSLISLRLILAYRPPNCDIPNTRNLCSAIADLSSISYPIVLMGDFNLPHINWLSSPIKSTGDNKHDLFAALSRDLLLTQYVTSPTHNSSILDLVFSNDDSVISSLALSAAIGSSDHCTVSFSFAFPSSPTYSIPKFNYNKADFDAMNREIYSVDWNLLFEPPSPFSDPSVHMNTIYDHFLETIHRIRDHYVPFETHCAKR